MECVRSARHTHTHTHDILYNTCFVTFSYKWITSWMLVLDSEISPFLITHVLLHALQIPKQMARWLLISMCEAYEEESTPRNKCEHIGCFGVCRQCVAWYAAAEPRRECERAIVLETTKLNALQVIHHIRSSTCVDLLDFGPGRLIARWDDDKCMTMCLRFMKSILVVFCVGVQFAVCPSFFRQLCGRSKISIWMWSEPYLWHDLCDISMHGPLFVLDRCRKIGELNKMLSTLQIDADIRIITNCSHSHRF